MKTESRIIWAWVLIYMLFDIADLISTIIGLSFPGIYEVNPVARYFFTFGNIGFFITCVYSFLVFFMVMSFAKGILKLYPLMTKQEIPVWLTWSLLSLIAVTFIIGKIDAIVNNIFVILHSLGF